MGITSNKPQARPHRDLQSHTQAGVLTRAGAVRPHTRPPPLLSPFVPLLCLLALHLLLLPEPRHSGSQLARICGATGEREAEDSSGCCKGNRSACTSTCACTQRTGTHPHAQPHAPASSPGCAATRATNARSEVLCSLLPGAWLEPPLSPEGDEGQAVCAT